MSAKKRKVFKHIYLEITNQCNLSCTFCHKTKRLPEFIQPDFFEYILKEIRPYTDYVYLHIMGEPLLHPNLEQLLELLEEHGFQANITTNATYIASMGEMLLQKKALRQLNYSLHSLTGNIKMDEDMYLKPIFDFVRNSQKQNKLIHCFRLWNLNQNIGGAKNRSLLDKIGNEFGMTLNDGVIAGNGMKLAENVFLQQSNEFIWPDKNGAEITPKGGCYGLKTHVGILCDGTVVPCCLDCEGDMGLGNLKQKGFESILLGEKAEQMRQKFRLGKREGFCRTCGFKM